MTLDDTYTYIARSAVDPARVVTFTFDGPHLIVDAGVPLELLERSIRAAEGAGEERGLPAESDGPWLKPLAVSTMERTTRPFHASDVYAFWDDEDLLVSAWVRTRGLRLAPVAFRIPQVDNPDAARAFVKEVAGRRAKAAHPGRFSGLLDYWASWIVGGLAVTLALSALLRPRDAQEA
jgi:hypothetical protein